MLRRALSALAAIVITTALFFLFTYQPAAPVATEATGDLENPLSFFEVPPAITGIDFWTLMNEMK